jgi:hypothetical protein
MSCEDDTEFWQARLDAVKAQILKFEADMLELNTTLSYRLSTGQTDQSVTRQQISQVKNTLQGLYNQYATLRARLCGGSTRVIPGF